MAMTNTDKFDRELEELAGMAFCLLLFHLARACVRRTRGPAAEQKFLLAVVASQFGAIAIFLAGITVFYGALTSGDSSYPWGIVIIFAFGWPFAVYLVLGLKELAYRRRTRGALVPRIIVDLRRLFPHVF